MISLITDKNPFDFLVYPETCLTLPMVYPPDIPGIADFFNGRIISLRAVILLLKSGTGQGSNYGFFGDAFTAMKQDFIYEFRHRGALSAGRYFDFQARFLP